MKLKLLAEAAGLFFATPNLQLRKKTENAKRKRARHICQWVACDAGYKKSVVARFWGMDRTSVIYGCKTVNNRIDTDPSAKVEMKEFMAFAKTFLQETQYV